MLAHLKEALVWCNYDVGRKCDPGEEVREVVRRRGRFMEVEENVDT